MLDQRKLDRIRNNRLRMRDGRTKTVVLIYLSPGATTYSTVDVVWTEQAYAEPASDFYMKMRPIAVIAEFSLEVDPRSAFAIADTHDPTAESVNAAELFAVTKTKRSGIALNRWIVQLSRLN